MMFLIRNFALAILCTLSIQTCVNCQEVMTGGMVEGAQYQFSDQALGCDSCVAYQQHSGVIESPGCYGGCQAAGCTSACNSAGSCAGGTRRLARLTPRGLWNSDQEYFQYEPNLSCPGDRLYGILDAQKLNGRVAQLAFYGFHFQVNPVNQQWHLTRSGMSNVQRLVRILPSTPGPILVDPTGDPVADETRAQVVREAFALAGMHSAPVMVGKPAALGVSGPEALQLFEQRQLPSPFVRRSGSTSSSTITPGVSAGSGATR